MYKKISVIIPVKNAGPLLRQTLTAVYRQQGITSHEVIIIDSGSTDESLKTCRSFPVTVIEIPAHEFGHGRTRNLGASAATGDIVVFLTQDAVPVGTEWLKNLVEPLISGDGVAGAYSRNIASPIASSRQKAEIDRYFPPRDRLQTSPTDHVFSNSSSAILKSVLREIPFPETPFGEDQLWAEQALQAGYAIKYQASSVVMHSHHYNAAQAYHRGRQEGRLAREMGQGIPHSSPLVIVAEAAFELLKWVARGDFKSCYYSLTMAAWHFGFRKGYTRPA